MTSGIALAKELGITYRQLWHWTSRNYVYATGDTLNFDLKEERIVRIMAGLVKFGMKPEPASELARAHVENRHSTTSFDVPGVGSIIIGG